MKIPIFILLIGISINARAQIFRNLSVKDGLTDLVVNALYKDSQGYLWVGTSSNVERFDGVFFKSYEIPETGEKGTEVSCITGQANGDIYFGTNTGLWKIDSGGAVVQIAPGKIRSRIRSLSIGADSTLYIGSEHGLYVYRDSVEAHIMMMPGWTSKANHVNAVCVDKDRVWMATDGGLFCLNQVNGQVAAHSPGNKEMPVAFDNAYLQQGVLYLSNAEYGIIAFDTSTCRFSRFMDLRYITSLSGNGADMLYAGTNGDGVHFINTRTRKTIRNIRRNAGKDDGLSSNSVYALLVDKEGIIWVGLFQLGLDYSLYQRNLFSTYNIAGANGHNYAVRTLEINGKLKLIGTRDGLIYVDENLGICHRFATPELRSNMVMCSYAFEGKYYVGTFGGGMYILDPQTGKLSDFDAKRKNPFVDGRIFGITADKSGHLWMGTSNGIYCYNRDGQMVRHYDYRNSSLPNGDVYRIFFDSHDRGWICTGSRLLLMSPAPERVITDQRPEGFVGNKLIRDIIEDSQHNLYFLPDKGRIFVSDSALSRYGEVDIPQLEGKNLSFMGEDSKHQLWIGTNDGLYRYDKNENVEHYNFADGLPTSVFLNCIPKQEDDGTLWFGTSQGVCYTNVNTVDSVRKPPYPLQMTDISHDGKICRLRFSNFTYTLPRHMVYEYRLEGRDTQWMLLEGKSEVIYYDLPAGNYAFRLRWPGNPESEIISKWTVPGTANDIKWLRWTVLLMVATTGGVWLIYADRKKKRKALLAKGSETPPKDKQPSRPYRSSNISQKECRELAYNLDAVMRKEKPYLNAELKAGDLADRLDIPAYKLSYMLSQHLNRTFYDYVNGFRVEEFKRMVERGEHRQFTLEVISGKCGFTSRASFFKYFKQITGMTPNQYIKSVNKSSTIV